MCEKIGQALLFVINIAFFVAGVILVALGIIALVDESILYKVTDFVTDSLKTVLDDIDKVAQIDIAGLIKTNAVILLVIGGVLFVMGVLGVCGARNKNTLMLKLYAAIVVIILVTEVALGVYAYMYSSKFEDKLQNGLRLALYKTYKIGMREGNIQGLLNASKDGPEYGMDSLQLGLKCCGITNNTEWDENADKWNHNYTFKSDLPGNAFYPPSCCILANTTSKEGGFLAVPINHFTNLDTCMRNETSGHVHTTPCYDRLKTLITDNQKIIIIVIVLIVAVEIVGIISALCIVSSDKK